jgi:DNA-binding transcriptional ArsR family regulator
MQTLEDVLGSRVNVAVLRYLTAIRGGLSGNEIAKRLGLQQSSVRQALERLVSTGVVTRTDLGRTAGYEVDHQLTFVRALLVPLFRVESGLRARLISALARDSTRLRPKVQAGVLFGSLARGMRDFRDVDLLFVVANERHKALVHDAIAGAFEKIRRDYKVPVSAIVATETELSSPKLRSAVAEARRDGLLLFGTAPADLRDVRSWRNDAAVTA